VLEEGEEAIDTRRANAALREKEMQEPKQEQATEEGRNDEIKRQLTVLSR
jgi:hypothetical protein